MEGIELVQCSTARTKTALFLLNLRFDYWPNSPLLFFFFFLFFLFSILLTDKLISLLSLVRMSDQDHHPPALQPRMELQVWELQVEEHLQEQHITLPKKHDDENIPHQT